MTTYRLQPWDEEVLRHFAVYHYLTIRQVREILQIPPTSYTWTSQHLKRLVDAEYLLRIERSIRDKTNGKIRRIDNSFALGKKGYDYLKREGIPTRKRRSKDDEYDVSNAALIHTERAVDLTLAFRRIQVIDNLQTYLDQWLKEHPFTCDVHGTSTIVVPDACVLFTRNGKQYICSIEVQNVGLSRDELGKKAEKYIHLDRQGSIPTYFGFDPQATVLSVLFVSPQGEKAANNIRVAIEKRLEIVKRTKYAQMFRTAPLVIGVYDMLKLPIWQAPFDETARPLFPISQENENGTV